VAKNFLNGRDKNNQFANVLTLNVEATYTASLSSYIANPNAFYTIPITLPYDQYALITASGIVGVSADEPVIAPATPGSPVPVSNVAFVNPNSPWTAINLRSTFINTATQFYIISPEDQLVSVVIYGNNVPPPVPAGITDNLGNPITTNGDEALITTN